jgi:prophage regulatory protein
MSNKTATSNSKIQAAIKARYAGESGFSEAVASEPAPGEAIRKFSEAVASEAAREKKVNDVVVRLTDVIDQTKLSRSSIYSMMADGSFPESFALGPRAIGWMQSWITDWITCRSKLRPKHRKSAGVTDQPSKSQPVVSA